jgi:FdhD protein
MEEVKGRKVFKASKFYSTEHAFVEDSIVLEEPLQINVNGKPFTVTMRTPGSDINLIRGLLYTEDIYKESAPVRIECIEKDEDGIPKVMNVWIPAHYLGGAYYQSRSMLSVSSCGICGKKELSDLVLNGGSLESDTFFDVEQLPDLFTKMRRNQLNFECTGGCHAAACFDEQGNLIAIEEDIGRHNAVDKLIGSLIAENNLDKAHCMLVSGRVSYEIVSKCFKAKIPFLAAVSSPSSISIETADALGICLMGFCRDDKMTCYTFSERLSVLESKSIKS